MSYTQTTYHIVLRTKYSEQIIPQDRATLLYNYIWGIIKNHKSKLFRINGMSDHIHILTELHPSVSLADFIKNIKVASSLWAKECGEFPNFKGWEEGYAAFTCAASNRRAVAEYIRNQQEHHKRESFRDELRRFLIEEQVDFDERYI